jgi:hypothetical protein
MTWQQFSAVKRHMALMWQHGERNDCCCAALPATLL